MIKYKIITSKTAEELEKEIQKLLDNGWAFVGSLVSDEQGFAREMVKEVKELKEPEQVQIDPETVDQEFKLRYNRLLGEKTRDLLYINGIVLNCEKGQMTTSYKGETTQGISPAHVLQLLKSSKHYPINADDKVILKELESLV